MRIYYFCALCLSYLLTRKCKLTEALRRKVASSNDQSMMNGGRKRGRFISRLWCNTFPISIFFLRLWVSFGTLLEQSPGMIHKRLWELKIRHHFTVSLAFFLMTFCFNLFIPIHRHRPSSSAATATPSCAPPPVARLDWPSAAPSEEKTKQHMA